MITPSAQKSSAAENPIYDRALRYLEAAEKQQPILPTTSKKQDTRAAAYSVGARKIAFLTRI